MTGSRGPECVEFCSLPPSSPFCETDGAWSYARIPRLYIMCGYVQVLALKNHSRMRHMSRVCQWMQHRTLQTAPKKRSIQH